jgi:hypothetical protein
LKRALRKEETAVTQLAIEILDARARRYLFKAQMYRVHAKSCYGVQFLSFGESDGRDGVP